MSGSELMLKLPKDIPAGAQYDAILARMTSETRMLWERGSVQVPFLTFTPKLAEQLSWAVRLGFATQGLEQISTKLEREEKGLALVAEKTGEAQLPRVSRLLFMANDGAERFYRECDSLLARYPRRLVGAVVDVPGADLGQMVFDSPKLVRALLIHDKKAVAKILLSLI